jgi:hypothetical protein
VVTITATIAAVSPGAGTPTGTVTFKDGATVLATGALSGGTARFTTSALGAGNHSITAVYNGDTNDQGSTSSALTETVNRAGTSTTLASSANPSVNGQAVTITATVAAVSPGAGTPTGTVTFMDGATVLATGALSGGTARFTTSALGAGKHSIAAVYNGDTNDQGSTSAALTETVNRAGTSTTLGSSDNPSVNGQAVMFTATIAAVSPGAGTPTGTVTFKDGATVLGIGALDAGGRATFTTSSLRVGKHSITAVFKGDTNFSGSASSTLTQTVNRERTATGLTSSANPSVNGRRVTFTATVAEVSPGGGTPTGRVTFKSGTIVLATRALDAGGRATFTTSSLRVGKHSITAVFKGSTNFMASTSAKLTQRVSRSRSPATRFSAR